MGSGSVFAAGDTISIARANAKMILTAAPSEILAVTAAAGGSPCQLAIPTSTASNFTVNHVYCRKDTNDGWYPLQVSGTDVVVGATKVTGTT